MRALLSVLAVLVVALGADESSSFRSALGPIPQDVYVWQRRIDADVTSAWSALAPEVSGGRILATQVRFEQAAGAAAQLKVEHRVDWRALPTTTSWIATFRLSSVRGNLADASLKQAWQAAAAEAARIVVDTQAAGHHLAGIEVDFDASPSQLAAFADRLDQVASALPQSLKPTFTALPVWLGRSSFTDLAKRYPNYVLQVHSLWRDPGDQFRIFDTIRAKNALNRAGRLGVPFRVALPTYAHVVATKADGTYTVISEAGQRPIANPTSTLLVQADPRELARFVAQLNVSRPRSLMGISWFRMPISSDRLNWGAATFASVRQGIEPTVAMPRISIKESESGIGEITVANPNDIAISLSAPLDVDWHDDGAGDLVAFDAYGDFRAERHGTGLRLSASGSDAAILPPGHSMIVAWARFSSHVPQ